MLLGDCTSLSYSITVQHQNCISVSFARIALLPDLGKSQNIFRTELSVHTRLSS